MNRRAFLRNLGLLAPAALVRPTYFLPPAGGWQPQTQWHFDLGTHFDMGAAEVTALQIIRRHGAFYTVEYEFVSYNGTRLS